ncbi:MAG TPA: hypothetical protein VJL80_07435 [Aeromicrobium sp.]|nr:hypothetical protein [Aeromicrobium sp.]HKY57854.1 hypothetical protein [Aeromicrobium sp.]
MARAQRIKTGTIEVHGLRELNRALKKVEGGTPNALRDTNKKVAESVTSKARSRATGLGGVAAHVAPSLRANAGATSAAVAGGGAAYPMFGGAEFGAIRFKQFQPWRGNGSDAGYFLYPAIRDEAPNIESEYREALDDLIRKAGLG